MRNRISAIIITKRAFLCDKVLFGDKCYDRTFDLLLLDECIEIQKKYNRFKGADAIITIGDELDLSVMLNQPLEIRRKWTHFNEVLYEDIACTIVDTLLYNLNRTDLSTKTFSIFVSTYNTPKEYLERLYNSLLEQTYNEWNLWIIDDSTDCDNVELFVNEKDDFRIRMFKNVTNHGSIGFNKHMIAMMCDGDYLLEMDHDDYLTTDCLELLKRAFEETNCDFVYADALELSGNEPILYGDIWGYGGYGRINKGVVNGVETPYSETPNINAYTIRTIYTQPNHPRCWRKDFYHRIGGHNTDLSVLDDQEILIRTFLKGKMCKVPKVLYIQDEGEGERGKDSSTAQSLRFDEIQRCSLLIAGCYDRLIHERILSLGHKDPCWDDIKGYSNLDVESDELPPINSVLTL